MTVPNRLETRDTLGLEGILQMMYVHRININTELKPTTDD